MTIINVMRQAQLNTALRLEDIHKQIIDTKLYTGRPEMLLVKMSNGRNVQLFRGGGIQVLGAMTDYEAEKMCQECLWKLKRDCQMENCQMSNLTLVNMVVHVHLNKHIGLAKIVSSNSKLSYECEIFPAALCTEWHPAHVAAFHNGKVIITGVKSVDSAWTIVNSLIFYLDKKSLFSS